MPNSNNIVVVGSINTDMVVMTKNFPQPGETIMAEKFFMNLGGKGANQAVAAARLGGKVIFLSRVGKDMFGTEAIAKLKNEHIDMSYVVIDEEVSSGIALINVDQKAENTIVVASGANANLKFDDLSIFDGIIHANSIVVVQLEIPLETVEAVCKFANSKGATVILNPAPAKELTNEILDSVNIITPNQSEAFLLSGIVVEDEASAALAAKTIQEKGPNKVIITMGAKGAYVLSGDESFCVSGISVEAKDTTAAGDVFNGALAVSISQGQTIEESVLFATKAAAISVTRFGAQDSAPYLEEIASIMNL